MSKCVVRMEMPDNCTCCPMCFTADVQGYHWCAALEQEVEEGLSRPKECPIICQLPEGHGRLVDADANFLGVIHLSSGGFVNYNTTIAERLGKEDMWAVKVIVPAEAERREI